MKQIPIFFLLFCCLYLSGCIKSVRKEKKTPKDLAQMQFCTSLENKIHDFTKELQPYAFVEKDTINLLCYLKVWSVSEDSIVTITMEGIDFQMFKRYHVVPDDYFVHRGVTFLVNDGSSAYKIKNSDFDLNQVIQASEIKDYDGADTRYPSWRIQLCGKKICKLNKSAFSGFDKEKHAVLRQGKNGLETRYINEWGEILNEKGMVIDTFSWNR